MTTSSSTWPQTHTLTQCMFTPAALSVTDFFSDDNCVRKSFRPVCYEKILSSLSSLRYQFRSEEDCVSAEAHQRNHPRPGHRCHEDPHSHHLQELPHGFHHWKRIHWRSGACGRPHLSGECFCFAEHARRLVRIRPVLCTIEVSLFIEFLTVVDPPPAVISVL